MCDIIGRKWTITVSLAVTFIGVGLKLPSTTAPIFFVGKFINGFAIGIMTASVLTYVSEVCCGEVF
jgi:MFS family permease